MTYRIEIDALRAIAVVAVLLYHAKVPGFSGGYIGVDVFFVISGFLITRIIHAGLESGEFTFTRFFASRIRRIVPAYVAVVLAVAACATMLHLPREMIDIGQSMLAAAVFATNILYWKEANYFAASAEIKPLLHTWSLAVEAQFYLFFPFVLVVLGRLKLGARTSLAALSLLFILSFAIAEITLRIDPVAAFFLLPSRIWEFGVGSILAMTAWKFSSAPRLNGLITLAGVGLIAVSVATYDTQTQFPGTTALLPCLGAALVILAGSPVWGPARILTTEAVSFTGRISYSLYLWHWPVFAIWRYVNIEPLDPLQTTLAIAASVLLAILSYYLIETPLRDSRRLSDLRAVAFLGVANAAIVGVGTLYVASNGLAIRLPPDILTYVREQRALRPECIAHLNNWIEPQKACIFGQPGQSVEAVLWGDSHAHALSSAAGEMFISNKMAMRFFGYTGCPPVPLLRRASGGTRADRCSAYVEAVRNYILSTPSIRIVVLSARHPMYVIGDSGEWGPSERVTGPKVAPVDAPALPNAPLGAAYAARLALLVHELAQAGKTVVLIKSVPEVAYDVPTAVALRRWFNTSNGIALTRPKSMYVTRNVAFAAAFDVHQLPPNTVVVDPSLAFCDAQTCQTEQDGNLLYYDDDHVSQHGARIIARLVEESIFKLKPSN